MSRRGKHPHNRLKAAGLRALPPGRHADGNRLYFLVRLNLARSWVQRVTVEGSRIDFGLGPYPLISLAEARRLAIGNLLTIRAGGNPKGDPGRKKGPTATVVDLLEVVIENRSPGWKAKKKTEAVWRHDFEKYVFPAIGGKPIATVTVADVRDIVLPHWRGRNSKGSVLRQNLESLFGCAVAYGYRLDNPAAHVAHILPKFEAPESHQASVPYREVPQVLVEWQNLAVKEPAKLALLFIVLTAARLTEVTGAKWGEFDLANHRWQVPANRMKGRKASRSSIVTARWQDPVSTFCRTGYGSSGEKIPAIGVLSFTDSARVFECGPSKLRGLGRKLLSRLWHIASRTRR